MLLSYIFLRVRYKVVNIMGVLLCLIGIATLVLADRKGSRLNHGRETSRLQEHKETERAGKKLIVQIQPHPICRICCGVGIAKTPG